MRESWDRKLLWGAGLMVALLAVDAGFAFWTIHQLREGAREVQRVQTFRKETADILQTLVDGETGQRGFVITGRNEFLEPYESAVNRLKRQLEELETHALSRSATNKIEELRRRARLVFAALLASIELRRAEAPEAEQLAAAVTVKSRMDEARQFVSEMQTFQDELLATQEKRLASAFRNATLSSILLALLGLGLFTFFIRVLQRGMRSRTRAAEALFQERERLRVTLTSIGDAVIATDTQGRVTLVNGVASTLTGWSPEEAFGKPLDEIFQIINETTRAPVENPVERVLREGITVGLANHTVLISRDQVERPIADSAAPIRAADGEIIGTVLVFRDVTEERDEDLAREEEARLTALRADVSTAVAFPGLNQQEVLQRCAQAVATNLNASFARIWTVPPQEDVLELKASAGDYTHLDGPYARVQFGAYNIGRIAQSRQPYLTNTFAADRHVPGKPSGPVDSEGIVAFAGYPLLIDDRLVGVLAVFSSQPFSQRVLNDLGPAAGSIAQYLVRLEAEEARRKSEEEFRTLANSIPQLVWIARPDGSRIWFNQRWYDYTGTEPAEMEGWGWQKVHHPDHLLRIKSAMQQALARGEPWEATYPLRQHDGTFHWHLSRMVPVRNSEGEILQWFGTSTDITQQRESEAALKRSEAFARGVIENSPDGVKVLDLTGRILWINENGYDLLQMPEHLLPQDADWLDFWPAPDQRQRARAAMSMALKGGVGRFQGVRPTLAGTDRWWDVAIAAISGPDDHSERLLVVSRDITEQRLNEERLRNSEASLRRVIDSMNVFVGILAPDGTLIETNRAPLERAGVTREMVVGQKLWDCVWWAYDPNVQAEARAAFARAVQGEVVRYDALIQVAGPSLITIDFMLRPIYEDEELKCVISSGVDITDRKRAEEQVIASRQFLRASLDALSSHIAVLDGEGTILAVNQAWRNFATESGLESRLYAVGSNYLQACTPGSGGCEADALDAAQCIQFVMQGIQPMCLLEYPCSFPSGRRWFQMRVTRFPGSGPVRVAVAREDITHRVLSEQVMLKRSEQLQELAGIATNLSAAQEVAPILEMITQGASAIIGAHQAHSQTVDDVPNPDQAPPSSPTVTALADTVRRTNRPLRMTRGELEALTTAVHQDGTPHPPIPLRGWLAAPLTGRDGRNIGLIELSEKYEGNFSPDDEAILVQLARMASVALENARLYQELREADQRKDLFLATLAHELRNPLSPLTSAAQLIDMEPENTAQVRELATVMSRQLEQLKWLIDDLLDVSRISSGKLNLRCEPMDLRDAVAAAVDVSQQSINDAGHTLQVTPPSEPLIVNGDKVRLSQVIGNLLINAAKYTPPGGQISLEVEAVGTQAEIRVRDTGIGIPASMLSKIFGLFTQVDSSNTRSQGGLGIGLTLVKTLTEMHSGTVRADSEGENRGSTFTVRLPLCEPVQLPPAPTTSTPSATPVVSENGMPDFRIMVVDDNHSASHLLSRLLERLQQKVVVAHSGADALEKLPEFDPDVIISDVAMPGLSGYQLAQQIRGMTDIRQPILIALTGYGNPSDRQEAFDVGFNEHLVKPVGLPALKELIQTLANRQ